MSQHKHKVKFKHWVILMNFHGYLELARQVSAKSDFRVQVGAVIVKGNRILSIGWNQIRHLRRGVKSYSAYNHSVHAERAACAKVDKDRLKGSTIFVSRSFKDGRPALALPCEDCYRLLVDMKISRIAYTVPVFPFYEVIKL